MANGNTFKILSIFMHQLKFAPGASTGPRVRGQKAAEPLAFNVLSIIFFLYVYFSVDVGFILYM